MDSLAEPSGLTVSQVLAAHACAQMSAARSSDEARRLRETCGGGVIVRKRPHSFADSWGVLGMCVGWTKREV